VSNRIRAIRNSAPRQLTKAEAEQLRREIMISKGLDPEIQEEFEDYLSGPSMASVMLKQAKGQYLRDMASQAREDGMEDAMAPMIASIIQLDR
jgi:hypothetical protein